MATVVNKITGKEYTYCSDYLKTTLAQGVESQETNEAVKHPSHYAYSKYEPVHVIREWGLNFNLGNVIKYVARAGRKGDILEDLKKARQYLDFEIEALDGKES